MTDTNKSPDCITDPALPWMVDRLTHALGALIALVRELAGQIDTKQRDDLVVDPANSDSFTFQAVIDGENLLRMTPAFNLDDAPHSAGLEDIPDVEFLDPQPHETSGDPVKDAAAEYLQAQDAIRARAIVGLGVSPDLETQADEALMALHKAVTTRFKQTEEQCS